MPLLHEAASGNKKWNKQGKCWRKKQADSGSRFTWARSGDYERRTISRDKQIAWKKRKREEKKWNTPEENLDLNATPVFTVPETFWIASTSEEEEMSWNSKCLLQTRFCISLHTISGYEITKCSKKNTFADGPRGERFYVRFFSNIFAFTPCVRSVSHALAATLGFYNNTQSLSLSRLGSLMHLQKHKKINWSSKVTKNNVSLSFIVFCLCDLAPSIIT